MDRWIPGALAILGAVLLVLWLSGDEVEGLQERVPPPLGTKTRPEQPRILIKEVGRYRKSDGRPADLPGAWPRFRGKSFDGVAPDQPELARTWGKDGPEVLWSIQVGEGHAGAAVLAGRVYLMDYDEAARRDALRCLSLADGKEIWRFSYPVEVDRLYGMSRTVPAVTGKYVVGFGPKCHVICLDAKTGAFKWGYDLVGEFHAKVPSWYAGQCPLIDKDRAIIAVGGDVLMMAVDCETGRIAWKTPNPRKWEMTHSSVMPMQFKGRRMYLYCASGGVVGVSAEDGRVLWEDRTWRVSFANVPSPVILDGGRIFLSGGYGAGSRMLRLREKDGDISPETLFTLTQRVFATEQHTAIFYNGYIYGVTLGGRLVCLDLSGRPVWASSRTKRFGKGRGSYLIADGLLYVMDDQKGVLTLVEATPLGYRELARARIFQGPEVYGPMAMAGGLLICRDAKTMVCLDVRRK